MPSVANLMIDSDDRAFQSSEILDSSPWEFQITRSANIQNGFFTRIGLTELVLNWCVPNLQKKFSNTAFIFDVSGADISGAKAFFLPDGFYTMKKAIDCVVQGMNAAWAGNYFTVVQDCSGVGIDISGNSQWIPLMTIPLPNQMGLPPEGQISYQKTQYMKCPDLRTIKYLDFVSPNLTYAQSVKDTNTTPQPQNVVQRWYMTWDDQNNLDTYGFPIYQGYTPFSSRKAYNPPKQIRYDPQIPVGNLDWEVWGRFSPAFYAVAPLLNGYAPLAPLIGTPDESSWMMSLQLSEV